MNLKTALLIPAVVLLVASCGGKAPDRAAPARQKAMEVRAEAAEARDWTTDYEATGTVRARSTATVSSRINGNVLEVRARLGDRVSAGQTLIVLDSRELESGVRKAEAMHAEAASMQPELESSIAAAKANLDLAEVTFQRMAGLYAKNSISNQEYDEAQSRVKAARANHAMIEARRLQLRSRVEQADEERRSASINRDYGRITAPFAGVVTERMVEPGNVATVGAPLLRLERGGSFRLEAAVDESRLASVRTGQKVRFKLDPAGCEGSSTVDEIVPVVDPGSRSYLVKLTLPCANLRSGTFGRALFATGARKVVCVPVAAVISRGQLQSVYVVEGGSARSRLLTLGERAAGSIEVLSGITAGEMVVISPPASLHDGASVEVRP